MFNDAVVLKKKFSATSLSDFPDQETYSNLPTDTEGKYQPQVLGLFASEGLGNALQNYLRGVPTVLVDIGTDQGLGTWRARKFKICSNVKNPETGTVHGLASSSMLVYKYQDQICTQLTGGGTNFTLAENNTLIQMNNASSGDLKEDTEIRCVGVQFFDDASGTFTGVGSTTPIIYLPDVLHFLLVCFGGVPTSRLDLASFTRSGSTKQGVSGTFSLPSWLPGNLSTVSTMRAFFNSQITVQEAAEKLAFSCGFIIVCNSDGKFSLMPLEPNTQITDPILTDIDMHDFEETLSLHTMFNRIMVNYFQIPAGAQKVEFDITRRKRKKKRTKVTLETDAAFLTARNELTRTIAGISVKDDLLAALGMERETTITTFLTDETAAIKVANYWYSQWGRGCWQAKFTDTDGNLMKATLGQRIVLYRKNSAHNNMADGKAYRLMDATKNHYNNTITVERADEIRTDESSRSGGGGGET